jgi:hypothetical protein
LHDHCLFLLWANKRKLHWSCRAMDSRVAMFRFVFICTVSEVCYLTICTFHNDDLIDDICGKVDGFARTDTVGANAGDIVAWFDAITAIFHRTIAALSLEEARP